MSIFNSDFTIEEISSRLKDVECEIYFIGVLGSGMYPLAKMLAKRGYKIRGSDKNAPGEPYTDDYGVYISQGDGTMGGAGLAVYSLAVDEDDEEILLARALGVPLISRAQLLGTLMSEYPIGVSVSGSHGKSTVTALIAHILSVSGTPHTAVSGATLTGGESFFDGGGDIFIAEACEYKDSFLRLNPTYQLINSVELDHTDYFADVDSIRTSFLRAAKKSSYAIINADDTVARDIAIEVKASRDNCTDVVTYGYSADADYRIHAPRRMGEITFFDIVADGRIISLSTELIGNFNLYNIAAAVAVTDRLGVATSDVVRAVLSFKTISRRLSLISMIDGTFVYYDYAHHPSEISAVISALKERHGSLTVIFRPHTYSRTKSLWHEFIAALNNADFTVLLDIYPAREKYVEGVDSKSLARLIKNCTYARAEDAVGLATSRHNGAIVLLGAGEVEMIKNELVNLGKIKNRGI